MGCKKGRTKGRKNLMLVIGCCLGALLAGLAQANDRLRICVDYRGPGSTLQVKIDNGCVSSSSRLLSNDLQVDLVENKALIKIDGGLSYAKPGPVAVTDCRGGYSKSFDFPKAKGRRYLVRHRDRQIGIADFSDWKPQQVCLGALRATPSLRDVYHKEITMKRYYKRVALEDQNSTAAPTIREIFEGLLDLAATDDATQHSFELEIFDWPLADNPSTDVFGRFTKYGNFDDKYSGKEMVGHFSRSPSGWQVHRLWQRHMCAQGEQAGRWSKKDC